MATSTNSHADGTSTPSSTSSHTSSSHSTTFPTTPLPIAIAGGGCVGLFLALLLAHSALPNPIIVLEPHAPDAANTRAIAHQPSTYPILAKVPGLLDELVAAGSLATGLCFRTGMGEGSRVIAGREFGGGGGGGKGGGGNESKGEGGKVGAGATGKEKPKGPPMGQLLLPQGQFQQILLARLHAMANVSIHLGTRLHGFTQHSDSVLIHTLSPTDTPSSLSAVYLLGADGAHSVVRKTLGIEFPGETLDSQLVATDIIFPFQKHGFFDANFIVDPQHWGLISRITPADDTRPALWRVSYGVPISLDLNGEQIRDGVDEKLREMLPNGGRDDAGKTAYEVVNVAPYKAQQRCATTFWQSRVGIVGDAAHLTNPYAGLGLAAGMADAASLAEVLTRVLRGEAANPGKLLAAWSDARRSIFGTIVDGASRVAYKRVRTDVSSEEKVRALVERDGLVAALKKGGPVGMPSLETRGEGLEGW